MSQNLEEMLKEAPSLTLEPFAQEEKTDRPQEPAALNRDMEELKAVLTPEEQKQVEAFAAQIDITDSQVVLQYGAGAQKKIADFSETALGNVRTRDLGEIGEDLAMVVSELRGIDEEEEKSLFGLFKRNANRLANMKNRYAKAEVNVNRICKVLEGHQIQLMKDAAMLDQMYEVNRICKVLEGHQIQLMKDAAMLDQMYELNMNYHKELSMYILAGKQKLAEVRERELPELLRKAEASGLPEDTQKARDMAELCNRFEKKVHDLELTRTVSMQMAPQIRLIQNNDTVMSEKIQSTLVNTIPLWKSQMVLAIGVEHSTQAAKAQREVTDMTNELLKKNAETLRMATVETARESERGIVDIETLKQTNETLIATLDEVMQIQAEGRTKRREAEAELVQIENAMREKLLEMSRR